MCHHRGRDRPWTETRSETTEDDEEDAEPSFLNEEAADDVEILTDGSGSDEES